MRALERKAEILKYITKNKNADVNDLAEMFDVSTMTIRRDLTKLEEEGMIITEYGGAVLKENSTFENDMNIKQTKFIDEKRRIAQECLEYINEGDTVYLDTGTTVLELARLLTERKDIKVITASLLVGNAFANSEVEVIMCPGKYRAMSMAYMGTMTDNFIKKFNIDKMFLSIEGIDENLGVSLIDVDDGMTKAAAMSSSRWVCCLADHSKFKKKYFYKVADLEQIDLLITDSGIDKETANRYKEKIEIKVV